MTEVASAKELIGRTAQLDVREFTEEEATDSGFLLPTTANTVASGLTGKDLEYARVAFDQATGRSVVSLEFTTEGGKLFEEITRRNLGKQLPVFIDEFPVTSPVVQDVISGGSAIISGSFTNQQAKNLAIQLNSGALPVSIHAIEEKTIGPSLGRESIQKSIIAGAIGLISVVVFMVLYYGKLGLLANIALVIYGLITYAIFRMIPITLTLPGIAAMALALGMAIDSNVLINERVREELRKAEDEQQRLQNLLADLQRQLRDEQRKADDTQQKLQNQLAERQRQLRDEQRKVEDLEKKVEALRAIDRDTLNKATRR